LDNYRSDQYIPPMQAELEYKRTMRGCSSCRGNMEGGENIDRFPIAMSYVPWQQWKDTYDAEIALERGTIFPELDFPFLGTEVM
jgi:hypothetical protein